MCNGVTACEIAMSDGTLASYTTALRCASISGVAAIDAAEVAAEVAAIVDAGRGDGEAEGGARARVARRAGASASDETRRNAYRIDGAHRRARVRRAVRVLVVRRGGQ